MSSWKIAVRPQIISTFTVGGIKHYYIRREVIYKYDVNRESYSTYCEYWNRGEWMPTAQIFTDRDTANLAFVKIKLLDL